MCCSDLAQGSWLTGALASSAGRAFFFPFVFLISCAWNDFNVVVCVCARTHAGVDTAGIPLGWAVYLWMGFQETGDSSIFFLKRILCGESYQGLLPRPAVFSFASKLRKGNLKTKWAKKVPQKGQLQQWSASKIIWTKASGPEKIRKNFYKQRGNYYTFLMTFNPEASQCLFLNQIHTTFAASTQSAGSKEDGPVRREPHVNYLGM